jgi:hypothetical protein
MEFLFEFAEAENILRLTLSGEMTDQAVLELWTVGVPIAASHSSCRLVVDTAGVTRFSVSPRVLNTMAKRHSPDLPTRIIVAPSDLLYGTSRMFQTLTESTRKNVHIVRTMQEAYKVLGVESPKFVPINPTAK